LWTHSQMRVRSTSVQITNTFSHTRPNTNASVCVSECMRRRPQIRVGTPPKREVTRSGASHRVACHQGARGGARVFATLSPIDAYARKSLCSQLSRLEMALLLLGRPSLRSRQRCVRRFTASAHLQPWQRRVRVTLSLYWRELIRRDADARALFMLIRPDLWSVKAPRAAFSSHCVRLAFLDHDPQKLNALLAKPQTRNIFLSS